MARCVLLTGSSGFLGSSVASRLLERGYDVIGVDPKRPTGATTYSYVSLDLLQRSILRTLMSKVRPQVVIHTGGISGPMLLSDRPHEVMDINVGGSLNLLLTSLEAGVRRFVFCSSVSAIGEFVDGLLPDDAVMQPNTPYGASKAAVDHILVGLYKRCSMELVSLRYTAIYGPGRQTAIPLTDIVEAALASRPVTVPVQPPWPYIYIDDAAEAAVLAALEETVPTQLFYNIAHPELVALSDIVRELRAHGLDVEVSEDKLLTPVLRGPVATEAAQRDLKFRAQVDYKEGLARMIAAARRTDASKSPWRPLDTR